MVCVEEERDINLSLNSLNEVICLLGRADTCHILDSDGINAHLLELLTHLNILLDRVNGRCCIADAALSVLAALLYLVDADFDVSEVVESIEDTEDIHAVLCSLTAEKSYNIIRVVLVAQDVLTTDEHLERSLLADRLDLAESLPGIFVEVTEAGIKCSAAPALKRIVTCVVQLLQYAFKILERHTGSDE